MSKYTPGCPVCDANSGRQRISPGPVIHEGNFWQVEHAYPTSLRGWLVIVLKRHAESLHEIEPAEALELGVLQRASALALHELLATAKEYSVCYGEMEGFAHLHVHLIPRAADVAREFRGGRVFQHLKEPEKAVAGEQVSILCRELAQAIKAIVVESVSAEGAT